MFEKYIYPALLIFVSQVLYLSVHTIRLSLTIKGKKQLAFLLSFLEISVYLLAINLVLTDIKNPVKKRYPGKARYQYMPITACHTKKSLRSEHIPIQGRGTAPTAKKPR